MAAQEEMERARAEMVELLRLRGVADARVLAAMARVRREAFFPVQAIPPALAYGDFPCPIGWGATISQPYIVAHMTELLALTPGERVLEIGTGSGYQAAVLAAAGARVWSQEVVPELAEHARAALAREGFGEVQVRCAGGCDGWRDEAPFDAILAACAPAEVPEALVAQLAEGGRMVLPVGRQLEAQQLVLVRRTGGEVACEGGLAVRFVPMV